MGRLSSVMSGRSLKDAVVFILVYYLCRFAHIAFVGKT
jgi:hypothetical protein